jgi:hypothetical protein
MYDASPDQEDIRDGFERQMTLRWTNTAREVKRAIMLHDALGIGEKAPQMAQPTSDKAEMFRRWLNERLAVGVGGYDGSWVGPFVRRASERGAGVALGDMQAGLAFLLPSGPAPSAKACHGATVAHLAGICEDVSQRAHDSVAHGLLTHRRPSQIARLVDHAFGHGLSRSRALAEHSVTQAFTQGTLDAMEARGVTHVGTLSERGRRRVKDAYDPDEERDERGRWTEGLESYRVSYQGRLGQYNPKFFRIEPDELTDDDGKVIATKDRVVPIREAQDELPLTEDPTLMYRGMSSGEYEAFKASGAVQSSGASNIGEAQQGLTYWTSEPRTAETYSSSFAPSEFKADFDKPAYVVVAKRVGEDRLRRVRGTGEHELGVVGAVPREDVVEVWRGNVIERDPGYADQHGSLAPSSRLHWQKLTHVGDAARKTPQPQHPRSGRFAKAHVVAREMRRSKRTGQFRRQGLTPEEQRKEELAEARFGRVEGEFDVLTAGDDRVCDVCDGISANGPYTINQARGLIPAHPNCRCVFVAAGSMEDALLDFDPESIGHLGQSHLSDFDPDEPRDESGKWTSSGSVTPSLVHAGGEEFVSPSVETGLSFADAKAALATPRQAAMLKVSDEIDAALGLTETARSVIGAWADGAENSVLAALPQASWDEIRLSAAMKGYVGDQKAVLAFKQDDNGDAFLYEMHAKGALDDIHHRLLNDGLAFHTLAPTADGADVYVADLDGGAHQAIQKAAEDFHASATYQRGRAEFIGTSQETGSDRAIRDDARRSYESVIQQSPVSRGAEVWGRNRDRWGQALAKGLSDRGYDPDEARDPGGRWTALAGSQGHQALVSTAPITATGRGSEETTRLQATRGRYTRIDMALLDRDPATKEKMVALFRDGADFPMIRESEWTGDTNKDAALIVNRIKSNLNAVWKDIPEEDVAAWRGWYEGAHNLVGDRMEQYKAFKIDRPSMTAVYAAQSPNTEWDVNVHLGDRLLDTYFHHADHKFDAAMREAAETQIANTVKGLADKQKKTGKVPATAQQNLADMRALFADLDGKTLHELTNAHQEAAWVKLYNDAHDVEPLRTVNVDGTFGDIRRKKQTPAQAKRGEEGGAMTGAFGTLDRIENAIAALRSHGDANVISDAVGGKHKVRSFYNNILDPNSPNDDVTIDTHAGGAAWLYPFGGKDTQVQQMLGGSVTGGKAPPTSAVTGIKGTYPFYADAYRQFAHGTGVLNHGREAQSVLWMKKIELFRNVPDATKADVWKAWQEYHDGKRGLAATQRRILDLAHAAREGEE